LERAQGPTSLGILSMRERAAAIGATVEIASKPGGGTVVVIERPTTDAVLTVAETEAERGSEMPDRERDRERDEGIDQVTLVVEEPEPPAGGPARRPLRRGRNGRSGRIGINGAHHRPPVGPEAGEVEASGPPSFEGPRP
jgi:hypothetical protein